MNNLTLITMAWKLHEQGVSKTKIAQDLRKHRETIILWIKRIEKHGLLGFLDKYNSSKKGPGEKRQADAILKRRI